MAERELRDLHHQMDTPDPVSDKAWDDAEWLDGLGRNLRVIHNRYSAVKMP